MKSGCPLKRNDNVFKQHVPILSIMDWEVASVLLAFSRHYLMPFDCLKKASFAEGLIASNKVSTQITQ